MHISVRHAPIPKSLSNKKTPSQDPRPKTRNQFIYSHLDLCSHETTQDTADSTSLAEVLVVRVNQYTQTHSYQSKRVGKSLHQVPGVLEGREWSFRDTTLPGPPTGIIPKFLPGNYFAVWGLRSSLLQEALGLGYGLGVWVEVRYFQLVHSTKWSWQGLGMWLHGKFILETATNLTQQWIQGILELTSIGHC